MRAPGDGVCCFQSWVWVLNDFFSNILFTSSLEGANTCFGASARQVSFLGTRVQPSFTDPLEILAGGVSEPEPLAIHGHLQSSRASPICVFQHPYSDRRAGFDLYLSSFSLPAGSWALPWWWWVHLAKQHMQNTIFRAVEALSSSSYLIIKPFLNKSSSV